MGVRIWVLQAARDWYAPRFDALCAVCPFSLDRVIGFFSALSCFSLVEVSFGVWVKKDVTISS